MTDKTKANDRTVEPKEDEVVAETRATAIGDVPETLAEPPSATPQPETGDDDPHANLAAYLLDSLPEDERAAFAAHFATCEVCQQEAATLAPIVGSFPSLLDLEPAADFRTPEVAPLPADLEPSSGLRGRILNAVREESTPPAAVAEQAVEVVPESPEAERTNRQADVKQAVEPTPISAPRRPPGRILPGSGARPTSFTTQARHTFNRVSWATRLAALFALVAVGAIIWALALQGRVNDLEEENDDLNNFIAQMENSGATVASLGPTADGKQDSTGRFFYSLPDQSGVVVLEGMNPLPEDQAYQLWYIKEGDPAPRPGPTITVDEHGNGVAEVAPDTPTYDQLAVTVEPASGSEAPTSPIVMAGNLSGAAG